MEKMGKPVVSIPLDRWTDKEAKIKDQAAEIERLTKERDKIDRDFTVYEAQMEEVLRSRDTQLADMRAALERLASNEALTTPFYNDTTLPEGRELNARITYARQALATDKKRSEDGPPCL